MPKPRYRLIATDVDGTLLDERGEVTPRCRAAIAAIQECGIALVLSTARPPRSIRALHRDLALRAPAITYNGALIHDLRGDRPILHRPIPRGVALRALAVIRDADPTLNVGLELADEWHVDRIDARLQTDLDAGRLTVAPTVSDLERMIATTTRGVSKLYVVGTASQRVAVQAWIVRHGLSTEVAFTSSGVGFVEVSAAGVDKGTALRLLADQLGVPLEDTIALGDGENDIPALRVAGLGIAMGHASNLVKRAAHAVTGPNMADGWAEAIERYVLAN